MDEARVKKMKEAALRERRRNGPPQRVCPGCGRLTRLVGEGLCGPCLRLLNAGRPGTKSHHAPAPPVIPGAGRRGQRTPGRLGGSGARGDLPLRALALLPMPNPPSPQHLTDAERQHRVAVFALQVDEMLAAGKLVPLDYSDPRLWHPDPGLSISTVPQEAEEDDDD